MSLNSLSFTRSYPLLLARAHKTTLTPKQTPRDTAPVFFFFFVHVIDDELNRFLIDSTHHDRQVQQAEAQKLAQDMHSAFVETSARTNSNVGKSKNTFFLGFAPKKPPWPVAMAMPYNPACSSVSPHHPATRLLLVGVPSSSIGPSLYRGGTIANVETCLVPQTQQVWGWRERGVRLPLSRVTPESLRKDPEIVRARCSDSSQIQDWQFKLSCFRPEPITSSFISALEQFLCVIALNAHANKYPISLSLL